MSDEATLTEDERQLVELYHDLMQQMSRAMAQHVTAQGVEKLVVGDAIRVLQGRLEGVGLAWYVTHGRDEREDDRLRELAVHYA